MRILLIVVLSIFSLCAQKKPKVSFVKIDMEILPILESKEIFGKGTYDFEIKTKVDSIFIDAVDMTFLYVALNGREIEYSNSGKRLGFEAPPTIGNHQLFLRFVAKPKQTVYFVRSDSEPLSHQVWTQGQGKYTSHWLPSFDDMNEKIELDLTILADQKYTVIANGKLKGKFVEDGLAEWKFDMLDPMSSYLSAFVIGDYNKKVLKSSSGIPIELYYEPKDSSKVEPTYRYTKEIFDFLEKEIGFSYPWQNYKQIPVKDFLYAGMENTGTTIFSNQYMIDSTAFVDKNYVNVNAHEMAHQWFGNLVTEESGKHHWLHEGFATYYAYLTEQHLFGDDYFYWKLYKTAKTLYNLSENGDGEALTNPNANSLTFYEKGAWALVLLKDKVGEEAFKKGVETYLKKYQFKNVTIADFIAELELVSNKDLTNYRKKWLESETFPWDEVKIFLMSKNPSIRMFFVEKHRESFSLDFLKEESPVEYKLNLINNFKDKYSESDYKILLADGEPKIRQKAIQLLVNIPDLLKKDVELLLNEGSYLTREFALYNLWVSFPKSRIAYLEKTREMVGLPNKNLRLLWLTLALVTPEYDPEKKQEYYRELNGYTQPQNHFEVRQLAFQYLNQIMALSDESLYSLIEACQHHVWQFKKSSRNLLRELVKDEKLKERLLNISSSLTLEQRNTLNKLINQ
ncbi:M1 family metallopeptidase [Croceitalea rosinachiae]|uniref:Aminopeptidase N n=1 Tax=Croceitalea rosinachiae TaxID=3075596 RepID=A0ABU3ACJ8_9FLAO|nr:M1 family metallopeptidase [Croceitalea sp. F388]MDT0607709.1 M1 family metallopeptidase [Croceitalea sp. F388]